MTAEEKEEIEKVLSQAKGKAPKEKERIKAEATLHILAKRLEADGVSQDSAYSKTVMNYQDLFDKSRGISGAHASPPIADAQIPGFGLGCAWAEFMAKLKSPIVDCGHAALAARRKGGVKSGEKRANDLNEFLKGFFVQCETNIRNGEPRRDELVTAHTEARKQFKKKNDKDLPITEVTFSRYFNKWLKENGKHDLLNKRGRRPKKKK